MQAHRFDRSALRPALAGSLVLAVLLAGCSGIHERTVQDVEGELVHRIPAGVKDRAGWARDIQTAFTSQSIEPDSANLCAVLAVIEQESGYQADPPVANLPAIARKAIYERAQAVHVPQLLVDAALRLRAVDGRSYSDHIDGLRTEQQLSALFEEMIARVPLGRTLLSGFNPIHTAGPMQVSIDWAEQHRRGYPYAMDGSVRQEVFSRRGGVYFGTKHLLGYAADYPQMLYRFADFNAGQYSSRNAAFQSAVARLDGRPLAQDGALLHPGTAFDAPGETEQALRRLAPKLGTDAKTIRAALEQSRSHEFSGTPLYQHVFALADAQARTHLPRAQVPQIVLQSDKITRRLTTAWYAGRVNARWKQCLTR